MHRLSWIATALVLGGCELFQPFEAPERGRLGPDDPEVVRIFAPVAAIGDGDLATVIVERVAHEGDSAELDPARLRCASVRLTGVGGFVDEDDPTMPLARTARADLDRGTRFTMLLASDEPGESVIRAELLAARCAESTDAAVLADALRTVRFVITEAPPEDDAGFVEEDAGL